MAGVEVHCKESKASCSRCGYNLTGLPSPRCPECGTQFDAATTPPFCVRLEHVLVALNFFALLMVALLICASPNGGAQGTDMDGVIVWAMLLPLQWVIALAGVIAGMHLFQKSGRGWMAAGGIIFPLLSVMISLFLGF